MLTAFTILWLAAACAIIGMALYRNLMAHYFEDDILHLRDGDQAQVVRQQAVSTRLDFIDRWGKTLTIAIAVYGLVLFAIFLYRQWMESQQVIP